MTLDARFPLLARLVSAGLGAALGLLVLAHSGFAAAEATTAPRAIVR
jgi:hypothetical protein